MEATKCQKTNAGVKTKSKRNRLKDQEMLLLFSIKGLYSVWKILTIMYTRTRQTRKDISKMKANDNQFHLATITLLRVIDLDKRWSIGFVLNYKGDHSDFLNVTCTVV